MSPSEIAFLALGLVLGAAVGAALAQAGRAWPAPRREVRLTITPNSIPVRRSFTLAVPPAAVRPGSPGGSPESQALNPGRATDGRASSVIPAQSRTRVPSTPVMLPATAVGVPVGVPLGVPVSVAVPVGVVAAATGVVTGAAVGVALLDAPDRLHIAVTPGPLTPAPAASRASSVRFEAFTTLVRPRSPVDAPRPTRSADAVPVAIHGASANTAAPSRAASPLGVQPALAPPSGPTLTRPRAGSGTSGAAGQSGIPGPASAAGSPDPAADPCAGQRRVVDDRCALADVAREQARRATDALREAQRAYDILRDRVDQAGIQADPRQVAAAKERLHAAFRTASDRAGSSEETEAAARAWLNEINALNVAVREALRIVEGGTAELRSRIATLERLAAEADAARIAGENAEFGCRDAREELAGCEENQARSRIPDPPEPDEPHPFARVWPVEDPDLPEAARPYPADPQHGLPLIVRVLHGDRGARDRLVATLDAGDPEPGRDWHLRISRLADAISGCAIQDGYLDLPDDDPFWRLFDHGERRNIVGALSALGFRFDGMGGFADERAPAARDLSLAVGYAGLERMRIRTWPRDPEIARLYERATVASDEWLADQAGDLSLGRMVDALGGRAADLADVWNAWGRVRPALLAE